MRFLTPLCTILLTISFHPPAARAQDSEIIINDNGNVPFEPKGRKPKKKQKRGKEVRYSDSETHIHYNHGIQQKNGELFIEYKDYKAVCLQTSDGDKIDLRDDTSWRFTTLSETDNAVISASNGNHHIHIDPGATMKYRPPNDLDDPDDPEHGKKNRLTGASFKGKSLNYLDKPFIIHYCGPKGCLNDFTVDVCADAHK